jgi:hypothetical protein
MAPAVPMNPCSLIGFSRGGTVSRDNVSRQEVLRVNNSVFVTYVFPQQRLPKTLTFKEEGKMRESAQAANPQTAFEEQDLPRHSPGCRPFDARW